MFLIKPQKKKFKNLKICVNKLTWNKPPKIPIPLSKDKKNRLL